MTPEDMCLLPQSLPKGRPRQPEGSCPKAWRWGGQAGQPDSKEGRLGLGITTGHSMIHTLPQPSGGVCRVRWEQVRGRLKGKEGDVRSGVLLASVLPPPTPRVWTGT